jgi:hypothetical protein
MDRRSPRAISLLAWFSVSVVVFVFSADLGVTRSGPALDGPPSSMVGPTAFAAIGPTAIPASSPWDFVLETPAPPTGQPAATTTTNPPAGPTSNPALTPTTAPTTNPTVKPTAKPTAAPTSNPTTNPNPTAAPTPAPTANPAPCPLFPSDNVWNRRVDDLSVRSDSATLIGSIGLTKILHPDFSSTAWNDGVGYGIPINKVNLSTPRYTVSFDYDDESDAGPYPIPANPKIEGGSDAHLLSWDTEGCYLYEIFAASKSGGKWYGGSGAIWNLRSNALRPNGWTSADAAGLPILPGLVRWDEVSDGVIRHALRFTAPKTCSNHIYPARHDAGSYSCNSYPPMGLRLRLKDSVDISGFGPQARVILLALKRYGMLLADNGSPWYVTGAPNANWDDDDLHELQQLHGSDFEAVDTSDFR